MHVVAHTSLLPDQLNLAFQSLETGGAGLRFHAKRTPPKFFLERLPVSLPAAAEVNVQAEAGGSTVVLRLMWGPLPAPFPRALAGVGLLSGLAVVSLGAPGALTLTLAGLLVVLPTMILAWQKLGESKLQAALAGLIGSKGFLDQPH